MVQEMKQFTAGHIVLGIHEIEITMDGVDDNAVRHADLTDLRGSREAGADNLMSSDIDNTIGDGIRHRDLTPLTTVEIEGIAYDAQVADCLIQMSAYLHLTASTLYQPPEAARLVGIVAARGHPKLTVFVGLEVMKVGGPIHAVHS